MVLYVSALYNIYGENDPKNANLLADVKVLAQHLKVILYCDQYYYDVMSELSWDNITLKLLPWEEVDIYRSIIQRSPHLPPSRNVNKDTLEYIALMNSKIEFLYQTSLEYKSDVYVWIDAGINKIVKHAQTWNTLARTEFENLNSILVPGCYDRNLTFEQLSNNVWWVFCGGMIILPSHKVKSFHDKSVATVDKWLNRNVIAWEVNLWVDINNTYPGTLVRYQADHNDSMLHIPPSYTVQT